MKQVDLEEPTPILHQVYSLECTQRECRPNIKIVQGNQNSFESLISAGAIKHLLGEQLYKVSTPCLDDHQVEKEDVETAGEFIKSVLTNRLDVLVANAHRQA